MAGYIRQSTFVDGDTITAALFNNEYNQLVNAFSNTSGHKHDGTTAEGPVIGLIGDAGETSPNNKVLIDTTNNYIEFYVEVSSAPVQQLYIADGAIIPVTDSDIDLGTTSLRFKDTYTDTVTTTGNVSIGGDLTVTGSATISGNLTFGDADTDSINLAAEIDSDIIPNTDGTYDLGSATKEWQDLYIDGTANIDSLVADTADINGGTIDGATIATSDITVGAGKTLNVSAGTLTLADDQISGDKVEGGTIAATTITTLTSTTGNITNVNATTVDSTNLEVTNLKAKDGTAAGSIADSTGVVTLASSVLTTTDINGGTIDGVTIGGTSAGAVTFTDLSDGTITIAGFADEDNMVSDSATLLPTQQSVKAYVDAQVTAQDLDFQGDTGGALSIDLDSESLTIAGGTGIDTSGATNTLTVAIDSTVATLTGTQTLTNKTLTSPDVNTPDIDGGTIDGTVIGGTTPAAGTFTTLTANTSITGTLATAAQTNITSVGTLSSLTVSGDATFDTSTLKVDSTNNRVGIGTASPSEALEVDGNIQIKYAGVNVDPDGARYLYFNNTDTTLVAGQPLGGISFINNDATSTAGEAAYIKAYATTNTGSTELRFGTGTQNSPSEAMRIDASGDLGINTASPNVHGWTKAVSLDGGTGNSAGYELNQNGTKVGSFNIQGDQRVQIINHQNAAITFNTNGAANERMRIESSGDVGIGVTNPTQKLHIKDADYTRIQIEAGTTGHGAVINLGDSTDADYGSITQFASAAGEGGRMRFIAGTTETMNLRGGNVGIGTSSPSGELHVVGTSGGNGDVYVGRTSGAEIHTQAQSALGIFGTSSNHDLAFKTNGTQRMRIDTSGNVGIGVTSPTYKIDATTTSGGNGLKIARGSDSFFEQFQTATGGVSLAASGSSGYLAMRTGTTAGTTTERMRIDSSGNVKLITANDTAGTSKFLTFGTNSFNRAGIKCTNAATYDGSLEFYTGNSSNFNERMRIDSSGNLTVGGTTIGNAGTVNVSVGSPGTTVGGLQLWSTTGGTHFVQFGDVASGNGYYRGAISYAHATDSMQLLTAGSERMRIDSSGNVLLGTTDTSAYNNSANSTADNGMVYENGNALSVARYNFPVTYLNRTGSDGTILELRKSGTTVGSIGTQSGTDFYITGSTAVATGLRFQANEIVAVNGSAGNRDAAIDIGKSNIRFKDLYLSGGAYLGGTGSANHLDDYEEGTWTPGQGSFDTWSTSPTFTATYTKIGRLVNIELRQTGGVIGWSAGDNMTGLPFPPTKGSIGYASDTGPSSDNGPILAWTNSAIYFNFAQGSEQNLVLNVVYETTA